MKEMLKRSARTFVQAMVGYLSVNIVYAVSSSTDINVIKTSLLGVLISAIAAGLAALMNMPKVGVENKEDESNEGN